MADVDHPKTHVEDQDIELPRQQPESPKREGIDPLTESDTMYPAENTKDASARLNKKLEKEAAEENQEAAERLETDVADQEELKARAGTPNEKLSDSNKTQTTEVKSQADLEKEEIAKNGTTSKDTKEAVEKDNADIEKGDLKDHESGEANTSPSNKTAGKGASEDVKSAEKPVESATPKSGTDSTKN